MEMSGQVLRGPTAMPGITIGHGAENWKKNIGKSCNIKALKCVYLYKASKGVVPSNTDANKAQ